MTSFFLDVTSQIWTESLRGTNEHMNESCNGSDPLQGLTSHLPSNRLPNEFMMVDFRGGKRRKSLRPHHRNRSVNNYWSHVLDDKRELMKPREKGQGRTARRKLFQGFTLFYSYVIIIPRNKIYFLRCSMFYGASSGFMCSLLCVSFLLLSVWLVVGTLMSPMGFNKVF